VVTVLDDVARRAPLLAALDDADAAAVLDRMTPLDVGRGDKLFTEGEPGDSMFIIQRGKVKLGQRSVDNRENLLAVLGPGQMLGELSLFDPGRRTATAVAVTPGRVLTIDRAGFVPLLDRPEVALTLLAALARRIRRTNEALADLVFSDVPGRVAKALRDLASRFGQETDDGILVAHDLTQEELAQLVGASRETVNKALADFTGRGWLRLEPRAVTILDPPRRARRAR
jgi:CRP-like cAMP-binding protein